MVLSIVTTLFSFQSGPRLTWLNGGRLRLGHNKSRSNDMETFSTFSSLGRVLVACEYSGSVRDAFAALGWDAWSCDILPSEKPGNHYQGDVRDILGDGWDILIAHPPCTHLAVSGARWFATKQASGEQQAALDFVRLLLDAPIPHIALENPISIISSAVRKPDQVIQPWQHGHGETKATCLWLKGLPKLQPSNVVEGREQRVWKLPPSADRWKERSRTFVGIAKAMAEQWTASTRPNNVRNGHNLAQYT
jgi:site-specific DNA-cytosine methylase